MNCSFADAINLLTDGQAAKRPSWRGYVKRVDASETEGAYNLVFVKPDGTTTYTFAISADGTITTSDTLTLDVDLFGALLSNDWLVGSTADFEAARSGTGNW